MVLLQRLESAAGIGNVLLAAESTRPVTTSRRERKNEIERLATNG